MLVAGVCPYMADFVYFLRFLGHKLNILAYFEPSNAGHICNLMIQIIIDFVGNF